VQGNHTVLKSLLTTARRIPVAGDNHMEAKSNFGSVANPGHFLGNKL